MNNRPMVNVPEGEDESNVYREMNDEEFAQWEKDRANHEAEAKAQAERPHPLVEQLSSMSDEDKDALRAALGVS